MSSIFSTYNRNNGNILIKPPAGCIKIDELYNESTMNVVPADFMVDTSTTLHPTKHPVIQQQYCYIDRGLLSGNEKVPDIYIESMPDFDKDYNGLLKSNYIQDLEMITYKDGTRLHNQEILLKQTEVDKVILRQPDVEAQARGEPDDRVEVHIHIPNPEELQEEQLEAIREVGVGVNDLNEAIRNLQPVREREPEVPAPEPSVMERIAQEAKEEIERRSSQEEKEEVVVEEEYKAVGDLYDDFVGARPLNTLIVVELKTLIRKLNQYIRDKGYEMDPIRGYSNLNKEQLLNIIGSRVASVKMLESRDVEEDFITPVIGPGLPVYRQAQ